MAGNRVIIRFIGEDNDLRRSIDNVNKGLGGVGSKLLGMGKGLGILGLAGNAISTLNGVVAAGQQLLPIALLLPAALLSGAAAFATIKLATAGFAEALSGDAKAMAKLAPSARDTAKEIQALKPQFDKLKVAVQGKFFAGFAEDVKRLGAQYLPMLQRRLPDIASGFNKMGRSVAFALTTPDVKNSVDKILGNTYGLLAKMPNALGHIVTGFITLGGAGSKYLPAIGRFLDGITDKFRRWADMLVDSGRFDVLIGAAKAGFSDLFKIVENVGSAIGTIWKGLSGGSGAASPLSMLRDMTGALREFFQSAAAQGPLQALGQTLAVVGSVLRDVVVAGLKALAPIVQSLAPIVQTLAKAVGQVLVGAFEQLGPPIQRLIDKLAPVINHALPVLANIITGVVIPAIASFIDWLATNIDEVQDFAMSTVIGFLEAGQVVLGFASTALGAMGRVFAVLSLMPGQFGRNMGDAARATMGAKDTVDKLRGTVDLMHSKAIEVRAETVGAREVQDLINKIGMIPAIKTVVVQARTSILGNILDPLGLGHRALGGPVSAGSSYVVGEHGPEVLTMGGSGYVSPNSGSGRGSPVVRFLGNTSDALATVIMEMIRTGKIQIA